MFSPLTVIIQFNRGESSGNSFRKSVSDMLLQKKKRTLLHVRFCLPAGRSGCTNTMQGPDLAFLSEQPQKLGGKLLVGLLTDVSRRDASHQRRSAAFPATQLQAPVTCFRRKRISFTITATELPATGSFRLRSCQQNVSRIFT